MRECRECAFVETRKSCIEYEQPVSHCLRTHSRLYSCTSDAVSREELFVGRNARAIFSFGLFSDGRRRASEARSPPLESGGQAIRVALLLDRR